MGQITDVVKHLIIINVIVFLAVNFTPLSDYSKTLALYYPGDTRFQPFQIVSHMFMHGGLNHLIMNMLGLFFLGPTVERFVGSKNFFILYFACGLGAVVLRSLVQYTGFIPDHIPAVGASGAVVGVVTAFATIFPHQKLYLMFIPVPVKAMYMMTGLVVFDLYCGFTGTMPGVAHFAHLGGAVVGFLMAWFWFKKYNFRR